MWWAIGYTIGAIIIFIAMMVLAYFGESFDSKKTTLSKKITVAMFYGIIWPITIPLMLWAIFGRY